MAVNTVDKLQLLSFIPAVKIVHAYHTTSVSSKKDVSSYVGPKTNGQTGGRTDRRTSGHYTDCFTFSANAFSKNNEDVKAAKTCRYSTYPHVLDLVVDLADRSVGLAALVGQRGSLDLGGHLLDGDRGGVVEAGL